MTTSRLRPRRWFAEHPEFGTELGLRRRGGRALLVPDDFRGVVQVVLAWVVRQPGGSSFLMGATQPEQLMRNVASLNLTPDLGQQARLDARPDVRLRRGWPASNCAG